MSRLTRMVARATLCCCCAAPLAAQDQPFVFVHGMGANASTWTATADALGRALRITPVLPTLNWTRTISRQATQLAGILNTNAVTAPVSGIPFAAHSLGGLVSRQYERGVADNKIDRLITIATPHMGAPIAASWYDNNNVTGNMVARYGGELANTIAEPIFFYDDYDRGTIPTFVYDYAGALNRFARNLNGFLCGVSGLCLDDATNAVVPFVPQTIPGSNFLVNLNSPDNLGRESASFAAGRTAHFTVTSPVNALFRLFADDTRRMRDVRNVAIALYQGMYQSYLDDDDEFLSSHATLWLLGEIAMIDIDANWQRLIGANPRNYVRVASPDGRGWRIHLDVDPSDGLLPSASVAWPGADNSRIIGNIGHTEQTNSRAVVDAMLANALRLGIPRRSATEVYTVVVEPNPASVGQGASRQLTATAFNADNARLTGKAFNWTSANTAIATVSSGGLVSGQSEGQTVVTASSEGRSGSTSVVVGTLTASVLGPASVRSGVSCTWHADVAYGVPPFEFAWQVGTKPQPSTSDTLTYRNLGYSFSITLTVTDAFGASATGTKTVTIASGAPACP